MNRRNTFLAFATASVTTFAAHAQTALVAHYRLDETTGTACSDSSGLGNHGTYMGGAALNQPGFATGSGRSVDFDGTTGYVDIPGSASLNALRDNFSVAAWVQADVLRLQRVFSNRRPAGFGSGGSWSFGMLPSGLRFTTLEILDYDLGVPINPTVWTHIAMTFDANFLVTFYVDGVAVGTVQGGNPSNPPSTANQYLIGVLDLGGGPPEWFDGRIDDVQVYRGTLTSNEVQFLFANPGSPLGGGTLGTSYCGPAVVNASGQSAVLTAAGSLSAAANNMTLTSSRMPLNTFGFFLTSRTQGFVMGPGGSRGNLCLGGAIGRYVGPGFIKNSGATGSFNLTLNLTTTPTPTGPTQVLAGQTWNYQSWFRDTFNGAATSNFTQGVSILYQ